MRGAGTDMEDMESPPPARSAGTDMEDMKSSPGAQRWDRYGGYGTRRGAPGQVYIGRFISADMRKKKRVWFGPSESMSDLWQGGDMLFMN